MHKSCYCMVMNIHKINNKGAKINEKTISIGYSRN